MTPIRVALIGAGDVAERDYLPEWHRLGAEAEIAVVCGRNEERVRRIARKYHVPRWSTSYLEVVESDIDAVVNLTPIGTLAAITLAAIEAGRHVYSEKPLALTSREARTIKDAAARRHLVLTCAPSIMLFPQIVRAGEILRSGELGVIRSARAHALAGVPPWHGLQVGSDSLLRSVLRPSCRPRGVPAPRPDGPPRASVERGGHLLPVPRQLHGHRRPFQGPVRSGRVRGPVAAHRHAGGLHGFGRGELLERRQCLGGV